MVTIEALIDTTVVVDLLRGYPIADNWLKPRYGKLGIAAITWLEVVRGAERKSEQRRCIDVMQRFPIIYPNQTDFEWSMRQFATYYPSHKSDINDCLIASIAYRLNVPLFTHNLKHIRPVLGDLAQSPY